MSSKSSASKEQQKSSEYAIVETSGTQFWLEANRYYDLDRINADIDQTITLDKILLLSNSKGVTIGQPYVKNASVTLKVMAHRRGPKILVYKMRPKKKTRRKNGHRQELTRVMVESISIGSKTAETKEKSVKTTKTPSKLKKKDEVQASTPSKVNKEVK